MKFLFAILLSADILLEYCGCADYFATLSHNGPVILGATISFKVEVSDSDGERPNGQFRFLWKDDAIPHHEGETVSDNPESSWNVSYPSSKGYVTGQYEVQVTVQRWSFIAYMTVTSQRIKFDITGELNGELKIYQSGVPRKGQYVSNTEEVTHEVVLATPDMEFISSATQVLSYWYVDCVYYGQSEGYNFLFNYTQEDQSRAVEVLVVASFEPLTTSAPSTTTTLAPTTSAPNPSDNSSKTELTSTSTTSPSLISGTNNGRTVIEKTTSAVINNVDETGTLNAKQNLVQSPNDYVPHICMNRSIIPPDPKKIYGYFNRQLKIKAPVTNVTVNGTNWLRRGDVVYLHIGCKGSYPYSHCFQVHSGLYNVTGNETCRPAEKVTESICDFIFERYFSTEKTLTLLIIISNDVNVNVTRVAINFYEVTKKAQLSVIVVPVVCTIMAAVLIIFGVAYYVQNRRRFVVEVADFHFGHTDVDMECKTFRERLREAIMNAFSRSVIEDDSDSDSRTGRGMWPRRGFGNTAGPSSSGSSGVPGNMGTRGDARGQKYGSME